jgi:hypothetical protein
MVTLKPESGGGATVSAVGYNFSLSAAITYYIIFTGYIDAIIYNLSSITF